MCIFVVLLSLIPVLSGYAVYLVVMTVITEGSTAVQVTVSAVGLALLLGAAIVGFKAFSGRRKRS